MGFFAKGKKGFPSRKAVTASETELTPRMGILQMADHISENESFNQSSTTSAESGSIPSVKISNSWKQKNHFFSSKNQQHNSSNRSAKKQQQQNIHATHKFQRLSFETQSSPPTLKELNSAAEQDRFSIPIALPLLSQSPLSIPETSTTIHHLTDTEGSSSVGQHQQFSGTSIKEKAKTKFFSKRKKTNKPTGKTFVALDENSISICNASDDVYEPPQGYPPEFPSDDYGDDEEEIEANLRQLQTVQKIQSKKKHSSIKKRGDLDACTFQRLEDECSTNEPGFEQDYEPPAFSSQSDSNEAGYETLTSLEYSGPPSSSETFASDDFNKPLRLSIDHSFSDPGFDVGDQVVQTSGHAIAKNVLNGGIANLQAAPSGQDKFSDTGSAEFSQFVFDHAFTRIKSVAVEKSDAGESDGFVSAAAVLTAALKKMPPPPPPSALPAHRQPQLQSQVSPTSRLVSSELKNKAQPKKFVIKMTQSEKKKTPNKARDEMPVLREAKGFENLVRKDPTRPAMIFQNKQMNTPCKNLVEDCFSLPADSADRLSLRGSPSSKNENIDPTSPTEKIFPSSSEATVVSSESSAKMAAILKSTKKPDPILFSPETKQGSNIIVVDDLDDDPFRVGTQADDTLWETDEDDPFHVVSKAKQQAQPRQRANRVKSELVERDPLIVSIRLACKRDARDCVKKPDPSPRGVQLASSSTSNELNTTDSNPLEPADGPKVPQPYLQSSSESDNATGSKTFNTYITSSVDMTEPSGPKISSVASTSSCETKDSSHDSSGYIMNPINNIMWSKYIAGEFYYKPPESITTNGARKTSKFITTKASNNTLDISVLSMQTTGESEADSDDAVLHGPTYTENHDSGPIEADSDDAVLHGPTYTENHDPGPIESSSSLTPSGIPSNAIMGSMLFRHTHSESTMTLPGSREKQGDDNEGDDDDDDDDDDDRLMQVPPSVEAIRTVESNVSSMTEEASSFYKSKFNNSCWNKQAHDVLNNYHKSRTSKNQSNNRNSRVQQQLIEAADQGHKYYI